MKKLIASLLLGAVIIAACTGAASAAVLDQTVSSATAVVRTSCEVAYAVEVPADTEIPFDAPQTQIGAVRADVMKIEPGKAVYVEVSSGNQYQLVNSQDAAHKIQYALSGDQGIRFNKVNDPTLFPLTVSVAAADWAAAYAGEHKDTLLFTISYR